MEERKDWIKITDVRQSQQVDAAKGEFTL